MLDTVWMRLTVIQEAEGKVTEDTEHFMFGPTGITQFKPDGKGNTMLIHSSGRTVATVREEQELLFSLIAKIRGTHGNKKQNKKARSKRKTPKK